MLARRSPTSAYNLVKMGQSCQARADGRFPRSCAESSAQVVNQGHSTAAPDTEKRFDNHHAATGHGEQLMDETKDLAQMRGMGGHANANDDLAALARTCAHLADSRAHRTAATGTTPISPPAELSSVSRHFIAMPRRRKNRHRGNHGGSRGDNGGNRSGSGWNRNTSRTMFAASSDPGDLFRAQIEEDAGSSESPITYESLHREIDWLGLKVRAFNDGVAAGLVQDAAAATVQSGPSRQQRRTLLRPRLHAQTTAARPITSTTRPSLMPLVSRRNLQTYKRCPLQGGIKNGVEAMVSNTQLHHVGPMIERVMQRAAVSSAMVTVMPSLPKRSFFNFTGQGEALGYVKGSRKRR
ncbi:hypothetical protein PCL_10692 [Purpureocillium lilacinum]|uniref:Uncharacterized protein n=1 Tax=Purpureocillium lilacinum TaxID=33203 RepID=A0A2U3EC39_PURLI|nr:hypothetical protein Purlil1_1386 [Purpureocillium lilacinum]PWI72069.1 hypothetical protein PCL_10692 [Purpureocillium lilacinum]